MPNKRERLPFIDSNIFIRFVAGDVPEQRARAAELFRKIDAGEIRAIVPPIVIFESVFTLSSPRLYHLPREQVVGVLQTLIRSPHVRVLNRKELVTALDLYLATTLTFGDCYIAANMKQLGSDTIYSFDKDFDRLKGITRQEP